MPGFLRLFTADEAILEMGLQYSNIVLLFTLPNVIAISFEKIFQAVGKMTVSMVSMMCGCVTNIILDPFLIFGIGFFPALGIKGAAIATGIGPVSYTHLGLYSGFLRMAAPAAHCIQTIVRRLRQRPIAFKQSPAGCASGPLHPTKRRSLRSFFSAIHLFSLYSESSSI